MGPTGCDRLAEMGKGVLGISHSYKFSNSSTRDITVLLEENPEALRTTGKEKNLHGHAAAGPLGAIAELSVDADVHEVQACRVGLRPNQEHIIRAGEINKDFPMQCGLILVSAAFREMGTLSATGQPTYMWEVFKYRVTMEAGGTMNFMAKHEKDPKQTISAATLLVGMQGLQMMNESMSPANVHNVKVAGGYAANPPAGGASPFNVPVAGAAPPNAGKEPVKFGTMKLSIPEGFLVVNGAVQIYSDSRKEWGLGQLCAICLTPSSQAVPGSLLARYDDGRGQKIIPPKEADKFLKPVGSTKMVGFLDIEGSVQVFSTSEQKWHPGNVVRVALCDTDKGVAGSVMVRYAQREKILPPQELQTALQK